MIVEGVASVNRIASIKWIPIDAAPLDVRLAVPDRDRVATRRVVHRQNHRAGLFTVAATAKPVAEREGTVDFAFLLCLGRRHSRRAREIGWRSQQRSGEL